MSQNEFLRATINNLKEIKTEEENDVDMMMMMMIMMMKDEVDEETEVEDVNILSASETTGSETIEGTTVSRTLCLMLMTNNTPSLPYFVYRISQLSYGINQSNIKYDDMETDMDMNIDMDHSKTTTTMTTTTMVLLQLLLLLLLSIIVDLHCKHWCAVE